MATSKKTPPPRKEDQVTTKDTQLSLSDSANQVRPSWRSLVHDFTYPATQAKVSKLDNIRLLERISCHMNMDRLKDDMKKNNIRPEWASDSWFHLPPPGFLSLRKEEPLPELSPQMPVSGYSWPRRTQVADKAVSLSCFRSSLPSCPFSWCPTLSLFLSICSL